MATVTEALDLALKHHQAGRLAEAERIYRQILAAVPNQPDAWHRLGLLACHAGNPTFGVEAITKAIAINPDDAAYYSNLGAAYLALGRTEEALKNHRLAVKINRAWPDGHYALGLALARANQLREAATVLAETTRLVPLRPEPFNELGIVLARAGRMDEAADAFRQATRLRPDFADAYNNLDNVRLTQNRLEEAVSRYRKALDLKPDHYQARAHLGIAYSRQGRTQESIECLEHAVELQPGSADAQNNLGNALLLAGRVDRALSVFRTALSFDPNYAPAISNYLLALNYDPAIEPDRLAQEHRTWAGRLEAAPPSSAGHDNT
ncbi:MAG TPA: tetratricopeptide repeat protein, partial [Pirellulales bacterium]